MWSDSESMGKTGCIVLISVSVVIAVALGLGLGLGLGLNSKNDVNQDYFDNVQDDERIDCYPEGLENAEEECQRRGCFWKEVTEPDAPQCFHPPSHGYDLASDPEDTTLGWTAQLSLKERPGRYERDINNLNLDVEMQTDSRLRFKIYAGDDRYEVPISVDTPTTKASNPVYDVAYSTDPAFGLKITRKSTGTVVFDSRLPGFTFDDQFLQISTRLPSANIYGFGEHIHESFRHDLNWKTWGIFTRDTLPLEDRNLYGHHPFYICVEDDGKAHGVFIMNSNAMDVTLLPAPILTYRIVGGVLDFYIFMGPTPENVVQQYLTLVGKPVMPPYWALGFHLSKWDYGSLTVMRDVVEDMRANNMPHDVQYADIDYMDEQRSFTVDPVNYVGLGDFIDEIHSYGQKFIIILDHSIAKMDGYEPYTRGHELDVFVKYNSSTNEELIGRMWPPGDNVFPDFMDESAVNWWTEQCVKFHNTTLDFDALWVDMNEPSNMIDGSIRGCGDDRWNNPPYLPKLYKAPGFVGTIYEETLCMDADHHGMSHYNVHSLYGYSHAKATHSALREIFPDKRSMVLTRSNFPSTSRYAYHWLGDNKSQWKHMKWSVIGQLQYIVSGIMMVYTGGLAPFRWTQAKLLNVDIGKGSQWVGSACGSVQWMMEFSLFGFPFIGADICGFIEDTTEEMCQRWMQLGAFYPFARNHNARDAVPQHPTVFSERMTASSREILLHRYTLLPFLYTLFYEANTKGSTVVRSLMHEFPTDEQALTVQEQFLWGPCLMIVPVMTEGEDAVGGYFPDARWYSYYSGGEIPAQAHGEWVVIIADLDHIPVYVRGGYILPTQEPANTTVFSRKNPLGLIVALDDNNEAVGSLYWDDGESRDPVENNAYSLLEFSVSRNTLTMTVVKDSYVSPDNLFFNEIKVYGLNSEPTGIVVDDSAVDDYSFDSDLMVLTIVNQTLPMMDDHEISWPMF
ncbi:Maltase-glucoamylase, intestinal [Holothuria leucospilota]|uniref:Maltase n=1 Tax=Holothuria leucospilota TaxID=206669 RepID=A0A9Q1CH59_HOLLE|nr:Maltase-glucoamylase, intestinal [Holothuria leucospilota]